MVLETPSMQGEENTEINERCNILDRYKHGKKRYPSDDDWEDPNFTLYLFTDRLGFIHDNPVPPKDKAERKKDKQEMKRVKKWLKIIKNWETWIREGALCKQLYKGLPTCVRGEVWRRLLMVDTVKKGQDGKYQELVEYAYHFSHDIQQINKDMQRLLRRHIMFRTSYGMEQTAVFNILCAYSVFNPEVGYCQGMDKLAGILFMFMPEEDAFWALSVLMTNQKFNLYRFYIPTFPKLHRFHEHHNKVTERFLPKLKKHLDENEAFAETYTFKWFFISFLESVPVSLALRFWDVYLHQGDCALIGMANTLLKMHSKYLLNLEGMQLRQFLHNGMVEDFRFDEDKVMVNLMHNLATMKFAKLDHPGPPPPDKLPKHPLGMAGQLPYGESVQQSHTGH